MFDGSSQLGMIMADSGIEVCDTARTHARVAQDRSGPTEHELAGRKASACLGSRG